MKGDGIYSRYFSPAVGGPGVYTFEVTVSDNGNTAYTWKTDAMQLYNKPLDMGKYFYFFCNFIFCYLFVFNGRKNWVIVDNGFII